MFITMLPSKGKFLLLLYMDIKTVGIHTIGLSILKLGPFQTIRLRHFLQLTTVPYFPILFTLKFKALWSVVSTCNSTFVMKNSPMSMEYLAQLFIIFFPQLK